MSLFELVLPKDFDATLRIRVDPGASSPSITPSQPAAPPSPGAASASAPTIWPAKVEAVLVRCEQNARTKKWPHRKVAEHMKAAGFTPDAPDSGKKAYVRWNVIGKKGTELSIYQDGTGLILDSMPQLAFALTLPGASRTQGKHPRVKWSYAASMGNALGAATKLREQANR